MNDALMNNNALMEMAFRIAPDKYAYCARCKTRVYRADSGYRKRRNEAAWLHIGSNLPWCPKTKQTGKQFPVVVPTLYEIQLW